MERLFSEVEEEPTVGAPKPAATPPAAPAAAAGTPPAEERPLKVRKPAPPKRPDLPLATPPAATPPPAQPAAAAAPQASDEEFEKGLIDGERQMLDDARYAEKANPVKYKGLGDRVKNYLKDHQKFLDDNPDISEDDPSYKKWMKEHRPAMSASDMREISEHRIAEKARGPVDQRVTELEHERRVQEIYTQLTKDALPDDLAAAIKEKGGLTKEIQEEFSEELEVANHVFSLVTDDLKEFSRLTTKSKSGRPLATFATDKSDPKFEQHERLLKLVSDQCENFKATGGADLQRNGKWFVTRDEWAQIDPARRGEFWTFTNDEIVKRALAGVKGAIKQVIEHKREDLKKRGYVRQRPAPAAPAPVTPPAPTSHPAPRPTPIPAGTPPATPGVDAGARSLAGLLNNSE
jgi:hypothetical protein